MGLFHTTHGGSLMENTTQPADLLTENEQIKQRRDKLTALRGEGVAFVNDFRPDSLAADLQQACENLDKPALEEKQHEVALGGRLMTRRVMGKASFAHLQDRSGQMQLFVSRDNLPDGQYAAFKDFDLGDIIGIKGVMFRTKTGELSVKVSSIQLLTKALRPLPDKYHGLKDAEQRYRQRYLDLISNDQARRVFACRSKLITEIRQFFNEQDYMEVETPMMQPLAGGAAARPFETHHNALNIPLFLRIAPELYLKRLVVGGFHRVYEINRNFRNEGVSSRHNPEFTMLEFYQAFATYHDLMDMTETLFRRLANVLLGSSDVPYQGHTLHMGQPFARLSVTDSLVTYVDNIQADQLKTLDSARALCDAHDIAYQDSAGLGKLHMLLFEELVEKQLIQPTFITEFPTEVSPLARANDDNPAITDRFELYAAGQEIANGFSELNDAEDQAERFKAQVAEREAGDAEAMHYDSDYITALEHGLPPTAGEGIGIDRLTMLFTDSASIREVILFPLMRPVAQGGKE